MGRIKPYKDDHLAGEFKYISRWLKKKDGLAPDEMADILGVGDNELLDKLTMISPSGVY